jgi:hypothetical protein
MSASEGSADIANSMSVPDLSGFVSTRPGDSTVSRAGEVSYGSAGETRDQKSLNSMLSNIADALVTLPSCISKSQK